MVLTSGQTPGPQRPSSPGAASPAPFGSTERKVLDQYCVICHNEKLKTANLMLDKLDLAHLGDQAQVGEKVVRKLRAGMMPPSGMRRPDPPAYKAFITWLENELDRTGSTYTPPPGLHRLNRTEYANVIKDMLDLDLDLEADLCVVASLRRINREVAIIVFDRHRDVLNIVVGIAALDYSHIGLRLVPGLNVDAAVECGYCNRRAFTESVRLRLDNLFLVDRTRYVVADVTND